MSLRKKLLKINACGEGMKWLADQTAEDAWATCQRGDWMLWAGSRCGVDLQTITITKVKCARLVQHLMQDQRSLDALDVAEQFALGNATREQLAAAAADAANAAADDAAYAASAAADDAAYAASAAANAAAADDAAYAASNAAANAAADDAAYAASAAYAANAANAAADADAADAAYATDAANAASAASAANAAYAASAAYATAAAAVASADYAAREKILAQCADICRKTIALKVVLAGLENLRR